jgi:hypothetical protein
MTCECRPVCVVQGVLWVYSRALGWHDPAAVH